jgi:hypothetical protein
VDDVLGGRNLTLSQREGDLSRTSLLGSPQIENEGQLRDCSSTTVQACQTVITEFNLEAVTSAWEGMISSRNDKIVTLPNLIVPSGFFADLGDVDLGQTHHFLPEVKYQGSLTFKPRL